MENAWKPKAWIAVTLGVLLQPFTFLYVNSATWFAIYAVGVLFTGLIDWYIDGFYALIFIITCPIHAYFLVKNYNTSIARSWYSKWWGIPAMSAVYIIPIIILRSFLFEPYSIPSASMSPSINAGEKVIVKKIGYGNYGTYGINVSGTTPKDLELKRGKIFVFYPPNEKITYMKRLIAIPGDTVEVMDGRIVLNGQGLPEEFKYEDDNGKVYQESLDSNSYLVQRFKYNHYLDTKKITVPENSYFFMGDNRDRSADSRVWGFVTGDRIVGEVVYVF